MPATSLAERITIPARQGIAALVARGQTITIINTHGEQVVDTWAFNTADLSEAMSMEHSRASLGRLIPATGDTLLTNHRRPILEFLDDSSGGIHDMLIAACDKYRYAQLGCTEPHDNCTDNLHAGLHGLGLTAPRTPCPLNLFMNVPVHDGNRFTYEARPSRPCGAVVFRAAMDLVIAFSACPQDILPINGVDRRPTEAHFTVA